MNGAKDTCLYLFFLFKWWCNLRYTDVCVFYMSADFFLNCSGVWNWVLLYIENQNKRYLSLYCRLSWNKKKQLCKRNVFFANGGGGGGGGGGGVFPDIIEPALGLGRSIDSENFNKAINQCIQIYAWYPTCSFMKSFIKILHDNNTVLEINIYCIHLVWRRTCILMWISCDVFFSSL